MKRLLVWGWLCLGCSKGASEITVDLNNSISGVERYIYILQTDANASTGRIYPDGCINLDAEPDCYALKTCGYSAAEATAKPQIPFSEFTKDAILSLKVCGVDSSGNILASGQTLFENTPNETVTLTLQGNAAQCALLSPVCP